MEKRWQESLNAKQMRWKFIVLFLLTACFPIRVYAAAMKDIPFYSKNIIIWNVEADTIVYEKNATVRTAPASLTKLVTALVVLDHIETDQLTDTITITQEMLDGLASRSATVNGLRVQDRVSVMDALKGMLIASGADSSNALASYLEKKTQKSYLSLVNQKIEQLQLVDTKLKNAHGLDEADQYTTAYDMAVIMKEFLQSPLLATIQSTYQDQMQIQGRASRTIPLRGTFLPMNHQSDIYQQEVVLGKTGITGDAGRCVSAYVQANGMSFIIVLMQAPIPLVSYHHAPNLDVKQLTPTLFQNYKLIAIPNKQDFTQHRQLGKEKKEVSFVLDQDPVFLVQKDLIAEDLEVSIMMPDSIPLPITEHDVVGFVQWSWQGEMVRSIDLVSVQTIDAPFLGRTLTLLETILGKYWMYVMLALLFYNSFLNYRNAKKKIVLNRKIAFKDYYTNSKKLKESKNKVTF